MDNVKDDLDGRIKGINDPVTAMNKMVLKMDDVKHGHQHQGQIQDHKDLLGRS